VDGEADRRAAAACRGVRGAITVEETGPAAIDVAVAELIDGLVEANGIRPDDVAAAIFTLPDDLLGANPAAAARAHRWSAVPLLMVREHGGDTRVPRCLRVLLLWNTDRPQGEVRHVYLGGADVLRPDLTIVQSEPVE
jgi:chorismate mutase